jgi:hypothetical protein
MVQWYAGGIGASKESVPGGRLAGSCPLFRFRVGYGKQQVDVKHVKDHEGGSGATSFMILHVLRVYLLWSL